MLVWLIAASAPRVMEATEMNQMICCHCATRSPKGPIMTRTMSATAATLGAVAKKAVTGVGAPSYTSGVHMWTGTAEILKERAAARTTMRSEERRVGKACVRQCRSRWLQDHSNKKK